MVVVHAHTAGANVVCSIVVVACGGGSCMKWLQWLYMW